MRAQAGGYSSTPPRALAGGTEREGGWSPRRAREAALARGREFRRLHPRGGASPSHARLCETNPALAALAENVRDYAVFLLDTGGIITYWGRGAHLMKWWLDEEAEGAHLTMLYPEGGAEDGTAHEHLLEAAERGEYVGEGQRIRRDGSTFWAGVTLTALRDQHGALLGFGKVTRDMTDRRAREAMLAQANAAQSAHEATLDLLRNEKLARARAEEAAEFAHAHLRGALEYISQVLEPELERERQMQGALGSEMRAYLEEQDSRDRAANGGTGG
jgi:PAS domain S-box-containing protein